MLLLPAIEQAIHDGYVQCIAHATAPLFTYNYTPKAQFDRYWNEATLLCRGLILNDKKEVIARAFPKFFNFQEHTIHEIPHLPFEVYDKLDGSLGILYWIEEMPYIATRGSFSSEQALHVTTILHTKYAAVFPYLNKKNTYLFEIIYPQNRIVVNYHTTDDLFLLAIVDTLTGKDLPLDTTLGFSVVKRIDGINNLQQLMDLEIDNCEGFVIKFSNDFRIKIKLEEYVRLHRIITHISSVSIWECMAQNTDLEELIATTPDEFYTWVKDTQKALQIYYDTIENTAKNLFQSFDTRKEAAMYYVQHQPYTPVLFAMLDSKDYSPIIWKMVRPAYERPQV